MKKDFLPKTLNGTPGRRVCVHMNVGRTSTDPHYHDCVEIIYVKSGEIRVFFDNGWHILPSDTLLFVSPGCIHRCVSLDEKTEQVVIGFTDELICEDGSAIKHLLCPYRAGAIVTGYLLSCKDDPEIRAKMSRLCNAAGSSEYSAQLTLCSDVLSIYSFIYNAWESQGLLQLCRAASPIADKIQAYVSENYASGISAKELSRLLNISYSYLAKLMTREFGTSLGNYIMSYRIETAKTLLLSTQKSIAEIGYECGFASSSAFICHFKKLTGKTPLVFRNEVLENTFEP